MHYKAIKTLFTSLLFSLSLFFQVPTYAMGMMGAGDNLSEEEQAVFDAISSLKPEEMEELAMAIQGEIDKMSPEQQAQFMQEVEREAARLQPKIEKYQKETEKKAPTPTTIKPKKTRKIPTIKKEPKVTIAPSKKKEIDNKTAAAEQYIAQILSSIDKLLGVSQTIPDFSQEVQDWSENNELQNWTTGMSWPSLESQLQELVRKLHIIKDRDVKTKEYKYLKALIENTSLYNNLIHLSSSLKTDTPHIEGLTLESPELSPRAVSAIKSTISTLIKAIYITNIIESLDKIVEEHRTTAEKIKEEREAMRERILAQPARRRPTKYVGYPEDISGFTMPSIKSKPTAAKDTIKSIPEKKEKTPSLPDLPKGGKKPSSSGAAPTSDKDKKDKKEKEPQDKTADKHIVKMEEALNAVVFSIEEGGLKKIQTQVSRGSFNVETMTEYIPETSNLLRTAIKEAGALRNQVRKLKGNVKKKYTDMYKKAIKEVRTPLLATANNIKKATRGSLNNDDDQQQKAFEMLKVIARRIDQLLKMKVD